MRIAVERVWDIPSAVEERVKWCQWWKINGFKFSIFLNLWKPFLYRNNWKKNGSGEKNLNLYKKPMICPF